MTMPVRCPSCGRVIASALDDLALPRLKKRLLDIVSSRPGIDAETLRELLWADDPNGGPEDRKVLHVHISQLNNLLRPRGFQVRGHVSYGYRVEGIAK